MVKISSKWYISIICIIFVAVSATIIYLCVPKDLSVDALMTIEIEDIVLKEEECKKIVCKTSVNNPMLLYQIDDLNVAKLKVIENQWWIEGVKEGTTTLHLTGTSNGNYVKKHVSIIVLPKDVEDNENDEKPEETPKDETEKPEDLNPKYDVKLNFIDLENFDIKDDKILIYANFAFFTITANYDILSLSVYIESSVKSKLNCLFNNSYMLEIKNEESFKLCFELKLKINENETLTYSKVYEVIFMN